MRESIDRIRAALDELELGLPSGETDRVLREFSAFELPEIIKDVVDYYNVRENRHQIFERDGYKYAYCSKQLTRFTATLDHIKPVSEGGDNSYDNVTTACLACNSEKTGKPLGDFLADRGGP